MNIICDFCGESKNEIFITSYGDCCEQCWYNIIEEMTPNEGIIK